MGVREGEEARSAARMLACVTGRLELVHPLTRFGGLGTKS